MIGGIRALSSPDWQPIETAPKDGSEILLGGPGWSGAGFYHDGTGCKRSGGGWFDEEDRGNLLIARDVLPTHWMPLPPPPQALENRGQGLADAHSKNPPEAEHG